MNEFFNFGSIPFNSIPAVAVSLSDSVAITRSICAHLGILAEFSNAEAERERWRKKEGAQRETFHIITARPRNYEEPASEIILFSRSRVRESGIVVVIVVIAVVVLVS